jgi:hypothetical protein
MVRPIKQITSKGRPFSEHVSSNASVGRPGKRPGQKQTSEPITEKSSRRRSEAAPSTMQWFQRGLPQTSWPAMRSGCGNRVNGGRIPGRGGGVRVLHPGTCSTDLVNKPIPFRGAFARRQPAVGSPHANLRQLGAARYNRSITVSNADRANPAGQRSRHKLDLDP